MTSRDVRKPVFALMLAAVAIFCLASSGWAGDKEPPLPAGLAQDEEPGLPAGLGEDEPALPPGLGEEPPLPPGLLDKPKSEPEKPRDLSGLPFDLTGFWETRFGLRTQRDHYEKDVSIGETRLQLDAEKLWRKSSIRFTADLILDPVFDHHSIYLEDGRGWLDIRKATYSFTPANFMDVKLGRQVLTWGTGDLLFINDMFPKDWNSFFLGRDEEYLKAPSDAVKVSFFSEPANLDIVYTPRFDPDRFIDGRRVSYWNGNLGRLAGRDAISRPVTPDDWFDDDEIAMRLSRNVSGYELALYGYRGFWKSPGGSTPAGRAIYPGLSVYGASARGNVFKGIGNVEAGYYDSMDDRSGDDPLVRNSEYRFLVGYEQEIARELTLAVQYYIELMTDYRSYRRNLPAGSRRADEDRHVATVRLTKLLMNQNLRLSLFTYYSPSDQDAYLRPNVHYKIDDRWSAEVGANVFVGDERHTFFGQFEKNCNVYAALRCSF